MTIRDALAEVQRYRPDVTLDTAEVLRWLSEIDAKIKYNVLDAFEGSSAAREYTSETDLDTELLVEDPYSEIYRWWLCAAVDMRNNNLKYYQISMEKYAEAYEDYRSFVARTHNGRLVRRRYW